MFRIGLVGLGVAAIALTTGCGSQGRELAALKNEKLATFSPSGGSLVLATDTDDHTALGKPIHAQVFRVFAFRDRDRALRAREMVMRAATAAGWKLTPTAGHHDLVYGSKNLPTGPAMLTLATYAYHGMTRVSILLEDRTCPVATCP
jgi:hypothetical protein